MRLMILLGLMLSVSGQSVPEDREPVLPVDGVYGNVYGWPTSVPDGTHAPIRNADVLLTDLSTGNTRSTVTDSAGFYSFECLDFGVYQLSFSKEGYIRESVGPFSYNSPKTAPIDGILHLDAIFVRWVGELWVRTEDRDGKPLEGVSVSVDGGDWLELQTNRCGDFSNIFKTGSHSIRLHKEGYRPKQMEVTVGDKPAQVTAVLELED